MSKKLPFNRPYISGRELYNIANAHLSGHLSGDGQYTKLCHAWLERYTRSAKALLTHSCTAALEMAALLLKIQPGDEVIMPSFTFVSTANAFVLRGAVPVFVDIREDTLNLDERLIESAITEHTRAVVPVHYAGVACEMDSIMAVAHKRQIKVVEDAAQGVMASYKGRALGSIGDLGAYSFHETKNVISGEGGALLVNEPLLVQRAEIIREKGTDRSRFFRGEVDKYTWQEVGSSFLPGELIAAFLWAQLDEAERITEERLACWELYHELLEPLEKEGLLRRPVVPADCQHNAHMYYVLLDSAASREQLLDDLKRQGIGAVFHYVPLHASPAGERYGRVHDSMAVTERQSERLVRLPLWLGISEAEQNQVVEQIKISLKCSG
ncbi:MULTISPECIES: dTDP-4-amino-4,6-dideoxygalactose transaminase [unclassified Pseudomonas]|uniref:dTDP-4-amino-4,6-dideoxygalactose transaminase n=1 Tax=unclassified Pseudomonas TaxID=196821 RepID=UPI0003E4A6B2|nr:MULTISPECIES: dTDP-4-amino-4,6-dideoxygalactose transaminase [unclassified Pseudomonas]NTX87784.1 dTDP-4-amino-4,6-dideoxygalactose transaminase [Pseudomonas sp. UMA643]NTY18288.1 dTDP-4-amino-4,6-dideoxygalactose transaminase [Pseudomonas sp. UMC3103]NTY23368.1 dTDP-4-amino-4,6-dideoxygalactose transaminase [Pseudomonas sp. UMA603]NTY29805.1 dTDP-4-amino-4,6-dideoxygalactose transaminase [Pseudomonas sp. UMC3129]NTY52422.1 dTDP-4-amino-4,6-dideoxygalactose transaminase [Pseudomonas sp. UMC